MTLWIMALLAALLTGTPATTHSHHQTATSVAIGCTVDDGAGGAPFDCPDGGGSVTPSDSAGGAPF